MVCHILTNGKPSYWGFLLRHKTNFIGEYEFESFHRLLPSRCERLVPQSALEMGDYLWVQLKSYIIMLVVFQRFEDTKIIMRIIDVPVLKNHNGNMYTLCFFFAKGGCFRFWRHLVSSIVLSHQSFQHSPFDCHISLFSNTSIALYFFSCPVSFGECSTLWYICFIAGWT